MGYSQSEMQAAVDEFIRSAREVYGRPEYHAYVAGYLAAVVSTYCDKLSPLDRKDVLKQLLSAQVVKKARAKQDE